LGLAGAKLELMLHDSMAGDRYDERGLARRIDM
jgi:hypothetical protein